MKQQSPIPLLFGWIALALTPTYSVHAAESAATAAAVPTGSITGRVQDVVTGQYLNNARVSVKGTDQVAFTDEFGTYRINHVRSGPVMLEVFYTNLDAQEISVDLPAGGLIERNVELTNVARYGQNAAVVKLDAVVVASGRETNAESIAVNEQRFAPNIKTVMSTDSLGVLMAGHGASGEFMKFLPGVTTVDGGEGVARISIRGIGSEMTSHSTDGSEIVNASNGNSRSFSWQNVSLNDMSRVEITKVPLPSMPADSLGGSINLVRKSAFEQRDKELRLGVILVGNSENLPWQKTPQTVADNRAYKYLAGFDLQYTRIFGRNLGVVFTWTNGNRSTEAHISRNNFNTSAAGTGASISRPFMQNYLLLDGPQNKISNTLGSKVDWRVTRHAVLSLGVTYNIRETKLGNLQFTPNAGTNPTPTPANGMPFSFGPDFTVGAAGRGSVGTPNINQSIDGELAAGDVKYRYDDGTWRLEVAGNASTSFWKRRNFKHGHFQAMNNTLIAPVRVTFSEINETRPGRIQVFDASNQEVDIYNINNYRGTTATDVPLDAQSGMRAARFDLRRQVGFLPGAGALQVGGAYKLRTQDTRTSTRTWNYNGPDGNPNTTADQGAGPLAMQVYVNQDSHYGFRNIPWMSSARAFAAWQANPALFSQTPAQVVAEENTRLTNSQYLEEAVSSGYVQLEGSLLKNRLKVLGGVRYEKTTDRGQGSLFDPNAVFVRNVDGTFVRNAQGARIRKAEAGAAASIEELRLTRKERAAHSDKSYDGFYPSLHFTYYVRENVMVRLAYARTYGRPDFSEITPTTSIQEADLSGVQVTDPTAVRGTLNVRNPSLKPWTAENYDLSVEYYTDQGGVFSAGVFDKKITNFFGESTRLATAADLEAVGLSSDYVGWQLTSNINTGDARIEGAEFSARHSLRSVRALGSWGAYFTLFANATKLRLKGDQAASFEGFEPLIVNWGGAFNRNKLGLTLRWNHHGKDLRAPAPAFGPDGRDYFKPRTTMDLSFAYQMTRHLSLVANVNNVFNVRRNWLRYGSETPAYARQFQESEYGAAIAFGVKGKF